MIETLVLIYLMIFIVSLAIFRSTSLKSYYYDRNEKFRDYMKVLGFALFWPVFLTVLLYGLFTWRK